MDEYIIGIDIGGTKTAVLLAKYYEDFLEMDTQKVIIYREAFSTPVGKEAPQAMPTITALINKILEMHSLTKENIKAIGISCGGPIDSKNGVILSPPNLYGWDSVPIVDMLSKEFNTHIKLQNDANACALAEWKFGAGRGTQNMIFLTMGTGMGAGLILNGALYSGTNDMAGEIGHMRMSEHGPVGYGKEGSFESFCSGNGIAQLARVKALEELQVGNKVGYCNCYDDIQDVTAKTAADAADNKDNTALEVYKEVGRYLGRGISVLLDILNPQRIVIGSIFSRSKHLMENSMYAEIEKEALSMCSNACTIVPCELGEQMGDFGAITVAIYG